MRWQRNGRARGLEGDDHAQLFVVAVAAISLGANAGLLARKAGPHALAAQLQQHCGFFFGLKRPPTIGSGHVARAAPSQQTSVIKKKTRGTTNEAHMVRW